MFAWRSKIGKVTPASNWILGLEYSAVLPDGVILAVTTPGVDKLIAEDFKKTFNMYFPAAEHLPPY